MQNWIVKLYLLRRGYATPDEEFGLQIIHDSYLVSALEPHSACLHELITQPSQLEFAIHKAMVEDMSDDDTSKVVLLQLTPCVHPICSPLHGVPCLEFSQVYHFVAKAKFSLLYHLSLKLY